MILVRRTAASRSGSDRSLLPSTCRDSDCSHRLVESYLEERWSKEKTMSWAA
jgi:hypothetical protein